MPFINIKLAERVFSTAEKHALAAAITGVLVKFKGSEAFRETGWVLIEELQPDGWHIGGHPCEAQLDWKKRSRAKGKCTPNPLLSSELSILKF